MDISIKLTESDSAIKKLILQEILKIMNKAIDKAIPRIIPDIKNIVRSALKQEPEYQSLLGGKLRAEFGIENPSDVDLVVDALVETLNLTKNSLSINNNGISGGFTLTMIEAENLNGITQARYANVVDSERSYTLPWLEWLLLRNNQILVRKYQVRLTNSSRSRSGMALMVQSNNSWRVPPEFSGSKTNNWTTRAISTTETAISSSIQRHIEASII